jgi:hypothetical protein
MITFQSKVLRDITSVIEAAGFQCIDVPNYSNGGKLSIQLENKIGELGSVSYHIEFNTMTFSITLGGKKIPSQPGRADYFSFYMSHTSVSKYYSFRSKLESELKDFALNFK